MATVIITFTSVDSTHVRFEFIRTADSVVTDSFLLKKAALSVARSGDYFAVREFGHIRIAGALIEFDPSLAPDISTLQSNLETACG